MRASYRPPIVFEMYHDMMRLYIASYVIRDKVGAGMRT